MDWEGGYPQSPQHTETGMGTRAASPTLTWILSTPQLHNAANANQKEKYEADLKKEIKKLQVRGLGAWTPVS